MRPPTLIAALAIILASTAPSPAQPNVQGAVELSNGTRVPQKVELRAVRIGRASAEGALAQAEGRTAAKDFAPVVGAKIAKGIKAQSLPTPVLSQIPELRDYMYVKMKDQVLIVNGMTNQIVDMFPETQPLS